MTRWEVVADGQKWAVAVVRPDGEREAMRSRFQGLSCIDAQVVVAELEKAHRLGRIEAIEAMRAQVLGD